MYRDISTCTCLQSTPLNSVQGLIARFAITWVKQHPDKGKPQYRAAVQRVQDVHLSKVGWGLMVVVFGSCVGDPSGTETSNQ